jgi:hypothetical protein
MSNSTEYGTSYRQLTAVCQNKNSDKRYFRVVRDGEQIKTSLAEYVVALAGSTVIARQGSEVVAMAGSRVDASTGAYVIAFDDSEITARFGSRILYTCQALVSADSGASICNAENSEVSHLTAKELLSLQSECKQIELLYV